MNTKPIINPPFRVALGAEACEGRDDFRFKIDFSLGLEYFLDFTTLINQGTIKSIQGLYVNNLGGNSVVSFTLSGTGQVLTVPAGVQAYLPVLVTNPPTITINCANPAQITFVQALNFFVPPYMWGGVTTVDIPAIDAIIVNGGLNVNTKPFTITGLTDASGTITAGGAYQSVIPASATRQRWTISNPSNATEVLHFAYGAGPGAAIDLAPGMTWDESGSSIVGDEVQVTAATTAHAFTAYYK